MILTSFLLWIHHTRLMFSLLWLRHITLDQLYFFPMFLLLLASVYKGTHGFELAFCDSATLSSISVQPARFNRLPCIITKWQFKTLWPRPKLLAYLQGNGMRRTGRTPIDVNAANKPKTTVRGVCALVNWRYHLLIRYAPADKKVRSWMGRQRSLQAESLRTLMQDLMHKLNRELQSMYLPERRKYYVL